MVVTELCRRAGWGLKHEMIQTDKQIEVKPYEDEERHYKVHYRVS